MKQTSNLSIQKSGEDSEEESIIKTPKKKDPVIEAPRTTNKSKRFSKDKFEVRSKGKRQQQQKHNALISKGKNNSNKFATRAEKTPPEQEQRANERKNTVFVKGFRYQVTKDHLHDFFIECGDIVTVALPRSRKTKRSRRIAWVTFKTMEATKKSAKIRWEDAHGQDDAYLPCPIQAAE